MTLLTARDLYKSFHNPEKVEVLSGVSLELERGTSIAIVGRSGEGKSTLLHLLGTLEEPDHGEILIEGIPFSPKTAHTLRNRHIGFLFQSFHLLEDLTALENVILPARIGRLPHNPARALSLLTQVGLQERAHFPAKLLSGGEKQRLSLARALCNNPSLLLADEPTGNLDEGHAKGVADLLFSLVADEKKSLILVTHDLELARRCDHIYQLKSGKLTLI